MRKTLKHILLVLFLSLPFFNGAQAQDDRDKKFIEVQNAAVATAHPEASRIAREILEQGGNAVDAAIAAAYAIGILEPTGSGLGGGGNAVIYIKSENKFYNLDFYPRSPMNPHLDYDVNTDASTVKAVSIPGFVAGMEAMRERWAVLERDAHIRPAIEIAREGFKPSPFILGRIQGQTAKMNLYDESRELFTNNGRRIDNTRIITNHRLADVMERVSAGGADEFYRSDLTQTFVSGLNELGGRFSLDDFGNYEVTWREPVRGSYRGYDVISAAPPVAGLLIIQSLHMMETFNFAESGHFTESPQSMHFLIEMFKRSYGDRLAFIGDPDFFDVPTAGLASKAFARNRVATINMGMAYPARLRDTEPGNPYNFGSDADIDFSAGVSTDPSLFFTDDMEDEASSFEWWGDDKFDSWGARKEPRREARRRGFFQTIFRSAPADSVVTPIEDGDDWRTDEDEVDPDNTTHITVIDKDGNVVSITSTIGLFFGSGITVNGVIMNSGQANFGSSPVNMMRPWRIPRSTIAPTIVMDGDRPFIVIGAAGGGRIPAAVVLNIHNIIDFGMDAYEASITPRFISRRWADEIEFEGSMPPEIVDRMRRMGHPVSVRGVLDPYFAGVQTLIIRPDGTIEAAADPRRDGAPDGY